MHLGLSLCNIFQRIPTSHKQFKIRQAKHSIYGNTIVKESERATGKGWILYRGTKSITTLWKDYWQGVVVVATMAVGLMLHIVQGIESIWRLDEDVSERVWWWCFRTTAIDGGYWGQTGQLWHLCEVRLYFTLLYSDQIYGIMGNPWSTYHD